MSCGQYRTENEVGGVCMEYAHRGRGDIRRLLANRHHSKDGAILFPVRVPESGDSIPPQRARTYVARRKKPSGSLPMATADPSHGIQYGTSGGR